MDLNVRAAARLLCVSETEIYRLVKAGELPHHMVHDQPRFNRVELLEHATARRQRISLELFEDERASANGNRLKLSHLLEAGGIHRDLEGRGPNGALAALAARVPLPEGVDRENVVALVQAHGGLRPLVAGVAIPHARSPVAVAPQRPLLALGFPKEPIACPTPDAQPVRTLFLVVSPSIRVHLDVLGKLATALLDAELLALLARRAPDDELLARVRAAETAAAKAGVGAGP